MGVRDHQGMSTLCRPKRKGQRAKPSRVSPFKTQKEKEPMETEETGGEGEGRHRTVLCHGNEGRKSERPGSVVKLKPMRSEKRLLDLGVSEPSEGNI